MKTIILILSALLAGSIASIAQCGKAATLTSSKTEYLDSSMTLQRTTDETSVVELSDSIITIAPGNEPHKMTATIKSNTCNWSVPYKEGKSIIKATLSDEHGNMKNLTITIEGTAGKVTLLAEVEDMPDRKIRVPIDTFKEKM